MNPVDRFQAVIRHPDYRNDPRLAFGISGEESCKFGPNSPVWWDRSYGYKQFRRVWGLNYAVDPKGQESIEKTLTDLRAGNVSIFTDDLRGHNTTNYRDTPNTEYGHFIALNVDLEQPTKELLELIRQMIDIERTARGIKTKRKKKHNIDPWDVWDKALVARGNLLQVTRTLLKVTEDPAYDEKTKRAYNQVQRAHRKAVSMIEEVGRTRMREFNEVKRHLPLDFLPGVRKSFDARKPSDRPILIQHVRTFPT